jgi:hypothetical protein
MLIGHYGSRLPFVVLKGILYLGAVFIMLTFLCALLGATASLLKGLVSRKTPSPVRSRPRATASTPSEAQPIQLYHGTTMENALEIHSTGLWMVGTSPPPAVWMTDSLNVAKHYARNSGGIVIVKVDPEVQLSNPKEHVYICEIRGAEPFTHYYNINGLHPVGVLDSKGNRIM